MTTIGILSEGKTDHRVIKQILLGFFEENEEHLYVNASFPPEASPIGEPEEGGWTVLKKRFQDVMKVCAIGQMKCT
jgi:hypothetical protein